MLNFLNFLSESQLWVQLITIGGGFILIAAFVSAVIFRLVKYGIDIKAETKLGSVEIDAKEDNDAGQSTKQG